MTTTVLQSISMSGVVLLLTQPDPQFYILLGVLVTSIAGLVSQRMNAAREERRHQWEREDRDLLRRELKDEVNKVAEVAVTTKEDIRSDIRENTAINVAALDAANHNDLKISALAAKVVMKESIEHITIDTNKTAHRIEEKL